MFSFRCLMFVVALLAVALFSLPQAMAGDFGSRSFRGNCDVRGVRGNCGARDVAVVRGGGVDVRVGRFGRTRVFVR